MNHAKKDIKEIRGSSLNKNFFYILFYTANAATTRSFASSLSEHGSLRIPATQPPNIALVEFRICVAHTLSAKQISNLALEEYIHFTLLPEISSNNTPIIHNPFSTCFQPDASSMFFPKQARILMNCHLPRARYPSHRTRRSNKYPHLSVIRPYLHFPSALIQQNFHNIRAQLTKA